MRGGERRRHLQAAHGGATGTPVVQAGEARRHQRQPGQQPEHDHGDHRENGPHLGLLRHRRRHRARHGRGDPQPAHRGPGQRPRPDQPAPPERGEQPEERERDDPGRGHGRDLRRPGPVLCLRRRRGAEQPQRTGRRDQCRRQAPLPGPPQQRTRERGHQRDAEQRAGDDPGLVRGPCEHSGGQGPADRGEPGGDPARGRPPAPAAGVEILGRLVRDVVHDGRRRRVLGPDEPQYGAVRNPGRLQCAVVRQRGTVRGDEMPQLGPPADPVVEQPHDLRQQQSDRLPRRQHEIHPPPLAHQRDPAERRPRPARGLSQRPRRHHAIEPITG